MIPKKLEPINVSVITERDRQSLSDNRNKINELIDFLQVKEEASKGKCKQCLAQCRECVECRKNLNPPEQEDEWVKLEKDYIDSFGEVFHTWSSYGWWIKYIRDNFVSKEKIKREIEHLYFSGICFMQTDPSGREIFTVQVDKSKESLGLGD